jgi:hypothetical protein
MFNSCYFVADHGGFMDIILAHKTEILAVLLAVSELLASVDAIKSNSIFQLVSGLLKKIAGK